MTLDETGEYQFRIEGQNCTASVRRSRKFTTLQRQGDAPPSVATVAPPGFRPADRRSTTRSQAEPAPLPGTTARPSTASRCAESGEPARVEVRPAHKFLRPGERFTFRTVALDANGCLVDARPTWAITSPGAKAPFNNAAPLWSQTTPSTARSTGVSFAGETLFSVEVATPARYDALLSTAP